MISAAGMGQEFGEPTGQMNLNMANSSEANGMMQETAANRIGSHQMCWMQP